MLLIHPGSVVHLNGEIKAFVNSVTIANGSAPTYNCGWWNSNDYKTGDFYREEFTVQRNQPILTIGFHNEPLK